MFAFVLNILPFKQYGVPILQLKSLLLIKRQETVFCIDVQQLHNPPEHLSGALWACLSKYCLFAWTEIIENPQVDPHKFMKIFKGNHEIPDY